MTVAITGCGRREDNRRNTRIGKRDFILDNDTKEDCEKALTGGRGHPEIHRRQRRQDIETGMRVISSSSQ